MSIYNGKVTIVGSLLHLRLLEGLRVGVAWDREKKMRTWPEDTWRAGERTLWTWITVDSCKAAEMSSENVKTSEQEVY